MNSKLNPADIYTIAVDTLPATDIDHYETDLYIRVTPASRELINRLNNKALVSTFVDQIEKTLWFELPFCYLPGWIK